MVSITPQVSSSYVVKFKENHKSKIRQFSRRVSRSATLDGDSIITDSGFTDTDRTLTLEGRVTEDQRDDLEYMIENYSLWNVVTKGECLSCSPKQLLVDNGQLKLTLLVAE